MIWHGTEGMLVGGIYRDMSKSRTEVNAVKVSVNESWWKASYKWCEKIETF